MISSTSINPYSINVMVDENQIKSFVIKFLIFIDLNSYRDHIRHIKS